MNKYYLNPLYLSILLFIVIHLLVLHYKPRMFFTESGVVRETGCGSKSKVILSYPMFVVLSSIVIYFICSFIL